MKNIKLSERHILFERMHQNGCFIIPNPWDIGSAKLMTAHGAQALATSSSALAFTLGRPDIGHISQTETLAHAETLLRAIDLPISADLENGFSDEPDGAADTISIACEIGLSGGSIEDVSGKEEVSAYGFELALDRIMACVDAKKSQSHPFILCARADGLMHGNYDLKEAINRVQAFEKAGADMVYIPALESLSDLERVVNSVNCPVNALAAGALAKADVEKIVRTGTRRISVGSSIARVAQNTINTLSQNLLKKGSFEGFDQAATSDEIDPLLLQNYK